MNSQELRDKFLSYFKGKDHKIIRSSSLLPADPSVLLTTAGMQQFSLYLSGKKDPLEDFQSRHLTSCQKCFRTGDIEEIGDDTHHTFFEMLGNWSIGQDEKGYFKEGAIEFAMDFLVNELGLDKSRFYVTVFKGEDGIARDEEAINLWLKQGIARERIIECSKKDNFWGPVSDIGPCGPCSEIHYDRGEEFGCGRDDCGPNCDYCKRVVEIWNLVFMQYNRNEKKEYELLNQTNIDTGIGFERLLSLLNHKDSAYETDIFEGMIKKIEVVSGKKYEDNKLAFRVIVDHTRSAIFLAGDGIEPSNVGQGYILRRIIRRGVRYSKMIGVEKDMGLGEFVIEKYKDTYPELEEKKDLIFDIIRKEEEKFEKTIKSGLSVLEKILEEEKETKLISGERAFDLYQSYGFPFELTEEIAQEKGFKVDLAGFEESLKKHQDLSRAGAEKKFGGVGKDAGIEGAKLHTATHLLHAALRKVLGDSVQQMGSDINIERLRFDFAHNQKMTLEEIKKVEDLVNEKIKEDLEVIKEEMRLEEASASGALAFFKEKYPERVRVWTIGGKDNWFSKEICAGPHVNKTSELGHFRIIKEESSSAGVRRIKAVLEK